MSAARFFVEGRHACGDRVTLSGADAHKIVSVLRKHDGDAIEIIDSAAQRFAALVLVDGRSVQAELVQQLVTERTALPQITVAQGIPKGQKMDFVVEKLTELGASSILPLQSERTVVSDVGANKLERWRRLAKSAAQQCGRAEVTEIGDPVSFAELLDRFAGFDTVLFPWELAQRTHLRERLPALLAGSKGVLIVIGPEGGFSHAEAEAASAAGAQLLSLGTRILRTETAGLVLVSLVAYLTDM